MHAVIPQGADHERLCQPADPRPVDLSAARLNIAGKAHAVFGDACFFRLLAPYGTPRALDRRAAGYEKDGNRRSGVWPNATRHKGEVAANTLIPV